LMLFLYAKRLLPAESTTRRTSVKDLLGTMAHERLKRIVVNGESSSEDTMAFESFVFSNSSWGSDSWVAFRDHTLLKDKPVSYVERIQSDKGLSYMHGPIALQHYLVAMQLDTPVGMVDIVKYLRQEMGAPELRNHVVYGFGESSLVFLQHLFPASSLDSFKTVQVSDPDVPQYLEDHGPALVTSFGVRADFRDEKTNVHLRSSEGDVEGNHALLMIGYRREKDELRFLLQNWWASKPFVEVNALYLAGCGAQLTFSTAPRLEIPASFTLSTKRHVESVHDVRERSS